MESKENEKTKRNEKEIKEKQTFWLVKIFQNYPLRMVFIFLIDIVILVSITATMLPDIKNGDDTKLVNTVMSFLDDLGVMQMDYSNPKDTKYNISFKSNTLIELGITTFVASIICGYIGKFEGFKDPEEEDVSIWTRIMYVVLDAPIVLLTFIILGALNNLPVYGTVVQFFSNWCYLGKVGEMLSNIWSNLTILNFIPGILMAGVWLACLLLRLVSLTFWLFGLLNMLALVVIAVIMFFVAIAFVILVFFEMSVEFLICGSNGNVSKKLDVILDTFVAKHPLIAIPVIIWFFGVAFTLFVRLIRKPTDMFLDSVVSPVTEGIGEAFQETKKIIKEKKVMKEKKKEK